MSSLYTVEPAGPPQLERKPQAQAPVDKVRVGLSVAVVLLAFTTLALAIALGVTLHEKDEVPPVCGAKRAGAEADPSATPHGAPIPELELRASVFDDLTADEINAILRFLTVNQTALAISPSSPASGNLGMSSNYIAYMERFAPAKAPTLAYLDGTANIAPDRFARVVVHRGADAVPNAVEYRVGPIDITAADPTAASSATVYNTIPWSKRLVDKLEYGFIDELIVQLGVDIAGITSESFNASYTEECGNFCLTYADTAPRAWTTAPERKTWFWFMRATVGTYQHPVGIEFQVDHASADVSQWSITSIIYNNQIFASVPALLAAYASGGVPKYQLVFTDDVLRASSFEVRGPPRPLEHLPPPRLVEPGGPRFTVSDSHVNYLGWSFEVALRQSCGLQLWDVRFKGERIIYELSLQEALATYGGVDVLAASSIYADGAWGMGRSMFELVPGADCPETAQFHDFVQYNLMSPTGISRYRNGMCIFEQNTNMPLRRHYDTNGAGGFNFVASSPSTSLVVRVISTVFNYDYIYDIILYLNGVVEVKMAASGYLQAVPYLSSNAASTLVYGSRVLNYTAGAVHDHIVHYKIDLDIGGTANTPESVHIDTEAISLPYFPTLHQQRKLTSELVTDETMSRLVANMSRPTYWTLRNSAKLNKWGTPRSYRVHPVSPASTLLPSSPAYDFVSWAKYHVCFTQYHDSEFYSTSNYDQNNPFLDHFSFDSYFNGESLVDQDVVVWASVGMQHIPHSEDMPVTTTVPNSASIIIRPYNYFDEDPSMDLRNAYFITPSETEGGAPTVVNFAAADGESGGQGCVVESTRVKYDGVVGDQ